MRNPLLLTTPVVAIKSGETVSLYTYEPNQSPPQSNMATVLGRAMGGGGARDDKIDGLYEAVVTDTQYAHAVRDGLIMPITEPRSGAGPVILETETSLSPSRVKSTLERLQSQLRSDKGI